MERNGPPALHLPQTLVLQHSSSISPFSASRKDFAKLAMSSMNVSKTGVQEQRFRAGSGTTELSSFS